MNRKVYGWKKLMLLVCLLVWAGSMAVFADELSGDNSLSSLGLQVEGATVTPDFEYSTIEYNVTVPAGTQEIILDPVTSNPNAEIVSITGQELTNGEGTVVITVRAENGSEYSYYLYVTSEAPASEPAAQPVTEKETQPPTEKETEPETEDPRYVRVARTSLEEAQNTIDTLKTETANYRDRLRLLMKILYGMIAFCVVLLFIVINLILKRKDLKAELREYAGYGYFPGNEGGGFPEDGEGQQGEPPYGYDENGGFQEGGDAGEYLPDHDGEGGYKETPEEYGPDEGILQEESGQPEEKEEQQEPIQSEEAGPGQENAAREQQRKGRMNDDPAEVPKPSKAKQRSKKMPEYREPGPAPDYQPSGRRSKKDDVEITMIDL